MAPPVWVTPQGSLGTIPEGVFYSTPLLATSTDTVYYQVIAGQLPPGIFIDESGILSGLPNSRAAAEGIPLPVATDTTSKFTVRAYTRTRQLADRTFTITVVVNDTIKWTTPPGNVATFYDGNQVDNLQINYVNYSIVSGQSTSNIDIYNKGGVVSLVAGQLPPGLTISTNGIISGYIIPNPITNQNTNYQFTLNVTNGQSNDIRTFDIYVYSLNSMTADTTHITADNTFITADVSPPIPPIITTPVGSIGTVRSDNFFAFQFSGIDFNYNLIEYISTTALPPGLTLDPTSGWLYGYIPSGGIDITTYPFTIIAREISNPSVTSKSYNYSLTITGPVNSDIVWLTPSNLGSINNGDTSTFYVKAVNISGLPLTYQLLSGSDSRLPQGLQLLPSGHIAGRVSFDTFALDGGTTTFDATKATNNAAVPVPTTFDMVCTFIVNATSTNGLVNVNQTFSIRVIRYYQEPFDNLYIQAMPPQNDRDLIASLVQNKTIFPPDLIYRNDDPNFGVATKVIYDHAYGLTAATYDDYVSSLNLNHYWKTLVLGEIKTAQALDDNGNVLYEVVYSEVVDNLVNNNNQSVDKEVPLPFVVDGDIQTVYPNSLVDMRTQVIDTVGQISKVLPRWMLSKQSNGNVLGFTPAWVIAYTNPGQSGQIAYNISTYFGNKLNLVDFDVDRYELDNLLTKNWDRSGQHWMPRPPTLTTFDMSRELVTWINDSDELTTWEDNLYTLATWTYGTPPGTTFDGGSLQFITPVDMYSNTNEYDKYLVFPKSNILG